MLSLPREFFSGTWNGCGHVQGIALDTERGYVYYSFTTVLVKTDLEGKLVGSVKNLIGHLGCITYDTERNCLYGSLEYKHDSIGNGIAKQIGISLAQEDAFYLVKFDVERIDHPDMDAEKDGIMTAVYLYDVVDDYCAEDEVSGNLHRYGCSGIDGVALGPVFGTAADSPKKLMVAYGIYSDIMRHDNDHQVLLQYDPDVFDHFGQPLLQKQLHHSGPQRAEQRYFVYTGNTTYGIQNLEYDAYMRGWFAAVYPGKKDAFLNPPLFLIDGSVSPIEKPLTDRNGESGLVLSLAKQGTADGNGIWGIPFPHGSTGFFACGNGSYYVSHPQHAEKQYSSHVVRYIWNPNSSALFCVDSTLTD